MSIDEAAVSPTIEPFGSLADLRREHGELLRATQQHPKEAGQEERITAFLHRARATGERIDEPADRDAAQGILDYWTATLLTATDPRKTAVEAMQLTPFDPARAPDLREVESPFMGLSAFQESDAGRFFGREEEVRTLIEKLSRERVLLVVGPSGSGKSSLVRAGLLPRLRTGALPGSKGWRYLPVVIPGSDPLASLLLSVRPAGNEPQAWVAEHVPRLQKSADHFRMLVEEDPSEGPAVLVVDQFEELFTLCQDAPTREILAGAIQRLALDPGSPHRAVLTVRDDFNHELEQLAPLAPLAGNPEARYTPPPLSTRELRRVIVGPAEMVGLKYDPGIADELVKEVVGEPAALPLLQFALFKLWERRERNRITWDAYRKVGSPREALKRTADTVFRSAQVEDRPVIERMFGELVQPMVGGEFVRRRVRREALIRIDAPDRVNRVLERFVTERLIRMTRGVEANDDRFEVVHEALIRNWPRLGRWLRNKRERSEKEIQLVNAARLWMESGRKQGYLLTGDALDEATRYASVSPELQELVRESSRRQRWRNRRVTLAAFAVAALAVAASLYLGTAHGSEREARRVAEAAVGQARAALEGYQKQDIEDEAVREAVVELVEREGIRRQDLPEVLARMIPPAEQADSSGSSPFATLGPDTTLSSPILGGLPVPGLPEYSLGRYRLQGFELQGFELQGSGLDPYDPDFLGVPIPLPTMSAELHRQAYNGGQPVDYYRYSLAFHGTRKLAIYTAANHDRGQRLLLPRAAVPFINDLRVPESLQVGDDVYKNNRFDRGHLTSRLDITWGEVQGDTSRFEAAVNVFTNATPQYDWFNQRLWASVERWVLVDHNPRAARVTLFSGPVFRADDYLYRGIRIPRSFWKIAVSRSPSSDGLVVDAFLADQYLPADPTRPWQQPIPPELGNFRTSVEEIERLTGLSFAALKQFEMRRTR